MLHLILAEIPAWGIALIVIAIVLAIAFGIALFIFLYWKKLKNTYRNLLTKYEDEHAVLINGCQTMLERINLLGQSNSYYLSTYKDRQEKYDDILSRRDKDVEAKLNQLQEYIKQKNYRALKEGLTDCQQFVNNFTHTVSTFHSDLSALLQDDSDVHNNMVTVTTKYHKIKNFYEAHIDELRPLQASFDKLLSAADKQFSDFNEEVDKANYQEARKVIEEIEKIVDWTLSIMDALPYLTVSVYSVIPSKIDELLSQHQKMIDDGFVVEQFEVSSKVEEINNQLSDMGNRLSCFYIEGVKEEIDEIFTSINDIECQFVQERDAKATYLKEQEGIKDSSFTIEKKYHSIIVQMDQDALTYVLDQKYVNQLKSLKTDIEAIGMLNREFDSFFVGNIRKPYITICKTMSELNGKIEKVSSIMNDYSAYIHQLKENSTIVFNGIRECYIQLKKARKMAKEISVEAYSENVRPAFTSLFERINQINEIVLRTPIDVSKASTLFSPFKTEVEGLCASVLQTKESADLAERKIVQANAYRLDYQDVRNALLQAEKCYAEADFDRAISISENAMNLVSSTGEQR